MIPIVVSKSSDDFSIELESLDTEEEALLVEEPPQPILTRGYIINGAVVIGTTAIQAFFNKIVNNNDLTSGKRKDDWRAMTNTGLTHVTNKVAKGNYLNVNSVPRQCAVLLAWDAQAVVFDLIAYALPVESNQQLPIGLATAGATDLLTPVIRSTGAAFLAADMGVASYQLKDELRGAPDPNYKKEKKKKKKLAVTEEV